MNSKIKTIVSIISSLLLTLLFYKNSLGLNLFISEFFLLFWILKTNQIKLYSFNVIFTFSGVLITLFATIITHSILSYFVNFLALFILIGILIYPETKSLLNSIKISLFNLFPSQHSFIKSFTNSSSDGFSTVKIIKRTSIFVIPILIIIVFIIIYSNSNPVFNELTISFFDSL